MGTNLAHLKVMATKQEPHAAPPDAGGHLGAPTVPEDLLNQNATEKRDGPQPPLQQNPPPRAGGFQGTNLVIWFVIAVSLIVGLMIAFR